jgi:phytoene desaturase
MDKKVIIIGAGIGGIAAAAKLAQLGYQVKVVEKGRRSGGRCDYYSKDGHKFDTGPTFVVMPDLYHNAFRYLGEKLEDHLKLIRVDPTYQLHFSDLSKLTLTSDLEIMKDQLESIEPGSFNEYKRYLKEGELNYRLSLKYFMERQFSSLIKYLNPINLYLMVRLKILKEHYKNVGKYFKDPRLRAAFTFQDSYLGLSPFEAPALFSMIQYIEFAHGVWFPKGGIYQIIEAFTNIAQKNGVEFLYGKEAVRINISGDEVTGVTLKNGIELRSDIVIGNADLPYIYRELLPDDGTYSKLAKMKYSFSALMYIWGVDTKFPQFDVHNLYLGRDFKGGFEKVVKDHSMAEEPNFYVHAPTRINEELAPPGQDSLVAIIPVGHLDEKVEQDWPGLLNKGRQLILNRLGEDGIKDLKEHIKFEITLTPKEWEKRYNLTYGSILSLGHHFSQLGYLRPHNRHKKFRNLYFCGGSTHPGAGLPTVLISARLVCDRIQKDHV